MREMNDQLKLDEIALKKILLVDDHKIIRGVLSKFLIEQLDVEIVEASNGIEGIKAFEGDQFDLVIADINMPRLDGIEMTKQIKLLNPATKVIALSMMDDPVSIKKMLKAGASAYVLKEGDVKDLLKAIEKVCYGETYYSHAVTETIMSSLADSRKAYKDADLTKRELEVLELMFKEFSNQEIADKLFISLRTVETHKHHIMEKTGAKNMAGLVKFAIREKLFDEIFY